MNGFGISPYWVDLVLLIFIFGFQVEGFRKGFFVLIVELSGFLLSIWGAIQFYSLLSQLFVKYFPIPHSFANAISFLIIGVFIESLYSFILLNILFRKVKIPLVTTFLNRFLGMLLGVVKGIILITFFLTILVSLPVPSALKRDLFDSKIGGPLLRTTTGVDKALGNIFGGAATDTLTFFTIQPGTTETVNLNFKTADVKVDEESEQRMFDLVNAEREKAGLKTLELDTALRDVAREHSREMFLRGYFGHIDPDGNSPADRVRRAGIRYFAVGENLALAPTVELAHSGLMNSPKHRDNILSPEFGKMGIGVMDGGLFGKMFTQNFTD